MGQRLLLVDSDRTFLKEHQVSLEAAFDLETSTSPEGVISSLEHGHHAAVLICVEVSDNKGYALCSTIRKNPKLAAIKVALISAKATDEEYRRHQSLKGRADLYLHKPIAPSALVAALTPLVPGRALDPDNPLGELVDTELGDDWLDNLKSTLDEGVVSPVKAAKPEPTFAVRGDEPVITRHLDATSTAPPDTTRARLLEEQVSALHEELRAKDKRFQETVSELAQLKSQLSAVTVNLDDLERRNRESESLAQQLSEKTQRTDELLKERDRLQLQTLEMDQLLEKAQELEKALADKQTELDEKEPRLAAALEAQSQLNATLEGLVEQHTALEGLHQAALLEVAGYKERAHTLHLEVAGLEATMRGQGRDLAELGAKLTQAEGELVAHKGRLAEREQETLSKGEALQALQEEHNLLALQLGELRQHLDETTIQHEGEKLELMNGLDQRESELIQLRQSLATQKEAQATLEREHQSLQGQLAEHRDRFQNLDAMLQEITEKLRRGSDLVRG